MKTTLLFAASLILFSSCSDIYSVYNSPGHIDWYQDDFKNTQTVKLKQKYLATSAQDVHSISAQFVLLKQLNTPLQTLNCP